MTDDFTKMMRDKHYRNTKEESHSSIMKHQDKKTGLDQRKRGYF